MSSASKLEMSLDEIIKAQKGGKSQARGSNNKRAVTSGVRKGNVIVKKRQFGTSRGKRQFGVANKNRFGQLNKGGRQINLVLKKRVTGTLRRKPIGNVGALRKREIGNKNIISATRNLVKKLVKKAIAQNVTSSLGPRRGKLVRIPANRLRQRTIVLNKVNPRSRVINRRRPINPIQTSPIMPQRRGRGPIRFATGPIMQNAPRFMPKRRNTISYVQQQPTVFPQQQISIREQINAMRRATNLQQLQSKFIRQQRQATRQQQQVIQVVQQPRQRQRQQQAPQRRRQQQQQYIAVKPQFSGGYGRGQRQQQRGNQRQQQKVIKVEPFFTHPNFLQRL